MADKIVVNNLYKVFGPDSHRALELLDKGWDKDRIFEATGLTVGVQDASFSVREGEIFVVMGLSGSGKSTLVRLLNRLIEPTAGEVLIDDRDIAKLSHKELIQVRRSEMSMVFQSFALLPHLTVAENAAFGLEIAGVNAKTRRERAIDALEKVGLGPYADSYPRELSGGMQQRVGLARALAVDPAVLLMDEAFSALDPLIRTEMQDELLRLQDQETRTIVFISHDLDEAIRIGDRIAVMEGGRIVQIGSPDEIIQKPADDYVRAFFKGVDISKVLTAGDVAHPPPAALSQNLDRGVRATMEILKHQDREYAFIHDNRKRFQGIVSTQSLIRALDH
ncbi:MAG: glycine betaine/L-proline ABC transporter ATP-binding protein ProV, partial [Candidatus Competibacteraceae bacterium]|nr:glycine betaine/L-proline ABC transporter ATP-binding protein ProV [Candidatus Competibacteraceae bacterium]